MPCRSFGGMETPTTLQNSYCVPKTEDEWAELGLKPHVYAEKSAVFGSKDDPHNNGVAGPVNPHLLKAIGRVEIPAPKFLDLLHDRIAPWRLKEVGFEKTESFFRLKDLGRYVLETDEYYIVVRFHEHGFTTSWSYINEYSDGTKYELASFTDLLTLIKFLTPPTK